MKRHLAAVFLSNSLLFCFGLGWLLLVLIPMAFAPAHQLGIWYEHSVVVLGLELGICVFAISWAISRIAVTLKQEGRRCTDIDY